MNRIPDTIPPYQFAMQIVQNLQQKQNVSEIVLPSPDHKELCVSLQNEKSNVIGLQLPSLLEEITQLTQDSFASAVCHALSFPLMKMSDINSMSSIQYDMLVATNNCDELLANLQAIFESYCNYQIELNIKPSAIPFKCLSDTSSLEILEQNSLCVNISSGKQAIIGQHCLLKLDHCNRNSTCLSIILLEIDKVMLSLNPSISSNAMWSLDEKTRKLLWHAFSQRDVYVPQSLFPPKCVHDISFWIRSGGEDDPKHPLTMDRLKSIIVQTADQSLSSIELMDEYNDGNCSSMCIRVTYQSYDFCLSRQNCSKLNDNVRKNISQVFNVVLR
uniref:ferredoxin-fold anticodon-binding domain-containing protein 1 homolog isoform X1 n=1 Tax=Styela clava TaxID=7725 RepID=UPI001939E679|nr:ferredoxin-fold anticodon-binding domain-containing protein 1 homolog isoform X1 [Styela clava]